MGFALLVGCDSDRLCPGVTPVLQVARIENCRGVVNRSSDAPSAGHVRGRQGS